MEAKIMKKQNAISKHANDNANEDNSSDQTETDFIFRNEIYHRPKPYCTVEKTCNGFTKQIHVCDNHCLCNSDCWYKDN